MKKQIIQLLSITMLLGLSIECLQGGLKPAKPPKNQKSRAEAKQIIDRSLAHGKITPEVAARMHAAHNSTPTAPPKPPRSPQTSSQNLAEPAPPKEPYEAYLARVANQPTTSSQKPGLDMSKVAQLSTPIQQYSKNNPPPAPSTPAPLQHPTMEVKAPAVYENLSSGGSLHARMKQIQGDKFIDPAIQRQAPKQADNKQQQSMGNNPVIPQPGYAAPPRPAGPPPVKPGHAPQAYKNAPSSGRTQGYQSSISLSDQPLPQQSTSKFVGKEGISNFKDLAQQPGKTSYLQASSNIVNNALSKIFFKGNKKVTDTITTNNGTGTRVKTFDPSGKLLETKIVINKKTHIAQYAANSKIALIETIQPTGTKSITYNADAQGNWIINTGKTNGISIKPIAENIPTPMQAAPAMSDFNTSNRQKAA